MDVLNKYEITVSAAEIACFASNQYLERIKENREDEKQFYVIVTIYSQ